MRNNNIEFILFLFVITGLGVYLALSERKISLKEESWKKETDSLCLQIANQDSKAEKAEVQRDIHLNEIFRLKAENKKTERDYTLLKKEKVIFIKRAEVIPADSSYALLQKRYPPEDSLIYPFSKGQVKSIYITSIESEYLSRQIVSLEGTLLRTSRLVAKQDTIISLDKISLLGYKEQTADYRNVISLKNQEIVFLGRKIKRQRVGQYAIGIGGVVLGVLIAK